MNSEVYFVPVEKDKEKNIENLKRLFDTVGGRNSISKNASVAIKVHFGEPGNTAFLKPYYIKPIVEKIKECKGKPFLTDANTLYKGERSDTKSHLQSAKKHGYTQESMGIPIIIADGPDSHDVEKIKINLHHFKEVRIAKAPIKADSLIAISHFKGHDCTGFGGAIKNVGMGLGSKAGKQQMHADVIPQVNTSICNGDAECIKWCPTNAISLKADKAFIDRSKCIGCAECIAVCPTGAISASWAGTPDSIQEKMAEYAYGVLKDKKDRCIFFNYLVEISPNCDCYPHNDPPIVPDIGFLASKDIVAIDQASIDLVNEAHGRIKGKDKFRTIYPNINWSVQLSYAEKIGLGSRKYKLNKV